MTHNARASAYTQNASKYLQQLCKHWSHKATATFTPENGTVRFASGNTLEMAAQEDRLVLIVTVPDDGDLAHFKDVVDKHLLRFAFREALEIDWTQG
ncbi:DUF2218 domain-containing protein [Shimia aestuarii]|uniref:DUF2218 domain-containing protein n=1 Tax=Shimia aestuarii TaxID=254406 RepID=A0A1I4QQ29_9RHOB|nr:DUF2218 domain-containing protein [Shimia aestuarii]SFM42192.1 hypothetical protein SAMN04488042_10782 [Shimia aestuarii]